MKASKSVKPFVALLLTRTPSTPRLFAHGFAMFTQTALHTGRRLTGRSWASALRASLLVIAVT